MDRDGTYGVLIDKAKPFAVTLERPYLDNKANISSIPEGEYICTKVTSPKFGKTYKVTNVPDRSNILFHKGNSIHDTKGCILIGEQFNPTLRGYGITHSGDGFNEFIMRAERSKEIKIIII